MIMEKEDIARTIIECHENTGNNIRELINWMEVLNCILCNVDGTQKFPVNTDKDVPVQEASFNDCLAKFIDIARSLSASWNAITYAFIRETNGKK